MKVFLSSTSEDLVEHRRNAHDAIERLGQQVGRMEVFGARPEEPLDASLKEVENCDLFVGIYAHRYGHVPEGSAISITESEFRHAKEKDKPLFCFLVDEACEWPRRLIEKKPGQTKLARFKAALQREYVRDTFTTPQDLAVKVATSLGRYLWEGASPLNPNSPLLKSVINDSSNKKAADRRATVEALTAAVEIANQTLQYLADKRRTGRTDRKRERTLSDAWKAAGLMLTELEGVPVSLIERYFQKGQYWSDPEEWTDERIAASRIALDKLSSETTSLLLRRRSTRAKRR